MSIDRESAARALEEFLRALGRDPEREAELVGTAERVVAAFADDFLDGYGVDIDALLANNVFAGTSDLVVVRDLVVTTICPHHLTPSTGTATVAFAPEEHLVGLGTVGALVDALAHRLAMQEQIGERVVAALQKHLAPKWVGCRIVMTHACMTARGERKHGSSAETVALAGGDVDEAIAYAALGVGRAT
jgi:GTP cyclohydrolase I